MSEVSEEAAVLEAAWRFAYVLTGCREGAAKVFKGALEDLFKHPDATELEKTEKLLFMAVRRRSLKFPAHCELQGIAARLHKLNEPGRSALTLLYLNALPAADIENILSVESRVLSEAVDRSRKTLQQQHEVASK